MERLPWPDLATLDGPFEVLWEDGERRLCRIWGAGTQSARPSCIAVLATAPHPSPASVVRLQQEYALREFLDGEFALSPRGLVLQHGRPVLILEDRGGEPLERFLGTPMQTGPFLRLAIAIADALQGVHERGLVHKDVKPANVFVDGAGSAWFTGFGIASRLPRERQSPEAPEVIAGTLAYMAPEQTGRMNRSIDSRSDLYSLGVMFYRMLTGALPFTASDAMEWVHCHIARRPTAPSERAAMPEVLSGIVMKLLAKTAEERYQTASGTIADLRRCLAMYEDRGTIDGFALGSRDTPDVLRIPEKLYGRESEVAALLAAFERVVQDGATQLVLVSGYSGIGKSSVVHELHKAIVPPRGLFASGKFEQYRRDVPYATLSQAFQTLVRQLLAGSESELFRWRKDIVESLGANAELMVRIIPELELVIGRQAPVPDLPPKEAQARFQRVFRRLINVFARSEHPLVLFLDDLQWLDAATLTLLVDLATQSDVRHLLLVGAYRDNEVGPSHPLTRSLDAIRSAGAAVNGIVLAPLRTDDVAELIADSLHCDKDAGRPLAGLVYQKTAGNPFFAIQFLGALAEEKLLWHDPRAEAWAADLERIHAKGYTENVIDLMVGKLERLPDETRAALKQLACLGSAAKLSTLGRLRSTGHQQSVDAPLWPAVRDGLILQRDAGYAFVHDRVQEAAYSLIPRASRPEAHLRIGRALWRGMQADEVIDVVDQLNRGAPLLVDADERKQVAELNLNAGRRAKSSTAYASACTYLGAGMSLLGEDAWSRHYELTFCLWLERAECEYLCGNFDQATELIGQLLDRSVSRIEKAAVYRLNIDLYVLRMEYLKATESALACLRLFGIDMPLHPTSGDVDVEFERVWRNLAGRPIEDLLDLPEMTDPDVQAAMGVLAVLYAPALFTDSNLVHLHLCHMVNMTLEHGTTPASLPGYAWFGVVVGSRLDRYADGYRFAKLACDLVEKLDLAAYRAKVYFSTEMTAVWAQPVSTALDSIRAAHAAALEGGDLTMGCYSCNHAVTDALLRGDHLDEVWPATEYGLEFARKAKFRDVVDVIIAQQRFIENMRGRTTHFSSFDGPGFDEAAFEADLTAERMATMVCWYWIIKLQARVLSGDYAAARDAACRAEALLWSSDGHIQLLDYHFYAALATTADWQSAGSQVDRPPPEVLDAHLRRLSTWAENGSATFRDRHALLAAEVARLEQRELDAQRLYEQAIRLSQEHRFIQNEALGSELAGRFYMQRGFDEIGMLYLRRARHCYMRWGAMGKVKQLDQTHPGLKNEERATPPTATIGTPVEHLDLATVIKVSQAVSGEMVLERLLETLMLTAIEHAGAERGLLILAHAGGHRVAAEATTTAHAVRVELRDRPVAEAVLPHLVLQYVQRTQESVILDDAATHGTFSADPYIRARNARSILCLPLLNQAKLIGVLYLENNLAPRVFAPARIPVLKLLASEAAISLENTRLYRDLAERESRIRRLVDANIIGIFIWDLTGLILDANDAFLRLVGYERQDISSGQLCWTNLTPPEWRDRDTLQLVSELRVAGSVQPREKEYFRKDGSRVPVLIGAASFADRGNEGVAFVLDLSERKRAEAEARDSERRYHEMEMRLAEANRIASIGQLSAAVAHELNQPLAGIVTNASTCVRRLGAEPPNVAGAMETAHRLIRDANRASEVIKRLRALFAKRETASDRLSVNEVACDVIALSSSALQNDRIELHCALDDDLPSVRGDRIQLQQVVMNLLRNAADAMRNVDGRPRQLLIRTECVEGDRVRVTVRDTGVGLDPDQMDKLFEAFYTTKSGSMGVGLSVSRTIVERHHGRLWGERNDGPGASFYFTIPVANGDERGA